MPYARGFIKVRINGVFGLTATAASEQWSTGFNVSTLGGGSVDPANLATYLAAISGPIATFFQSANLKAGTNAWLTGLTAAYIGTDGRYVLGALQPTTVYTYATPVSGSGTPVHNLTTALVLSLRSSRLRGPASHGRMYWPALAQPVNATDGTALVATLDAIVANAKTMIDSINTATGAAFGAASKVSLVSQVGAGLEAVVISLKMDQKLDHMESRERNVVSKYSTATPVVAAQILAERDEELRRRFDELEDAAAGQA